MGLFTKKYIVAEEDGDHPDEPRKYEVTVTNDDPSILDGEFVEIRYYSERHGRYFSDTYDEEPTGIAEYVEAHENSRNFHLNSYFYVEGE